MWALTGSNDNTALLWDLKNPDSSPRVLSGHTSWITSVALASDGTWALTGSYDNTARALGSKDPGSSPRVLSGHTDAINVGSNHT